MLDKYGGRYTWESIDMMHNIAVEYIKLVESYKRKAAEMRQGSGGGTVFMQKPENLT